MSRLLALTPRLPVADLQRTEQFYVDELGFQVCVRWPEEAPRFLLLERDGARLAFDRSSRLRVLPESAQGLYLHVEDVLAEYARLSFRYPFEWGPEVYDYGCREAAFRDPDGYLIILSEETDDAPTCAS